MSSSLLHSSDLFMMHRSEAERELPGARGPFSAADHPATRQGGETAVIYQTSLMYSIYHDMLMCFNRSGERRCVRAIICLPLPRRWLTRCGWSYCNI